MRGLEVLEGAWPPTVPTKPFGLGHKANLSFLLEVLRRPTSVTLSVPSLSCLYVYLFQQSLVGNF